MQFIQWIPCGIKVLYCFSLLQNRCFIYVIIRVCLHFNEIVFYEPFNIIPESFYNSISRRDNFCLVVALLLSIISLLCMPSYCLPMRGIFLAVPNASVGHNTRARVHTFYSHTQTIYYFHGEIKNFSPEGVEFPRSWLLQGNNREPSPDFNATSAYMPLPTVTEATVATISPATHRHSHGL